MDCLNNLIGISRRTGDTSTSGLYLEDRSITLEKGEATNEIFLDGKTFIESIIAFSQKEMQDDFIGALYNAPANRKSFIQNTVLQSDTVGFYQDDPQLLSADAAKMRGVRLETDRTKYISLQISSLSLMLQDSVTLNIEVWDLLQNKKVGQQEITTVANEITTVDTDITVLSNGQKISVAILYDGATAAYKTYVNEHVSCLGCKKSYRSPYCITTGVEIDDSSDKYRNNFTSTSNGTSGLSVGYSLQCDPAPLMCNIKNRLALPLLYKVEANIYKRMLQSGRINSIIKLPTQDHQTSYDEAMALYQDKMNNLINGMVLPSDPCFKCNSRLSTKLLIP